MARADNFSAAADDILLFDATNMPSPRRVRICLIEKGVAFTSRWMALGMMDQKQPDYLAINSTGMVPTLLHRGTTLFDSNVINEYLDAVYPLPSLVPSDPLGQAQMRMWFAVELDIAKPFREASYETLGKTRLQSSGLTEDQLADEIQQRTNNPAYLKFARSVLTTPPDEQLIRDRLDVIFEKIDGIEKQLADGRTWLCGDQFTLADICMGPRMDMYPIIGVDDLFERYPRLGAWMARLRSRPSWQKSDIVPAPGETERAIAP
jgi:glutathione S-transferase